MSPRRLTRDALLTAFALAIYVVELQLPSLVPIPGVKLGLANIITLVAMFWLGPADAAGILFARIVLGGIFSGQLMSFVYSLAGGTLCYLATLLLRKIVTSKQIWVCGVFGAIAHNVGQIAVASAVVGASALAYLPALTVSGIITGLFTGLCAQFIVHRMKFFK